MAKQQCDYCGRTIHAGNYCNDMCADAYLDLVGHNARADAYKAECAREDSQADAAREHGNDMWDMWNE